RPVQADHAGGGTARQECQPNQGRNSGAHGRQFVPLHDLFAHSEGDHARGIRNAHRLYWNRAEGNMNTHVKITSDIESADLSRRSIRVGTAATGLALRYSGVPGITGPGPAFSATPN